MSRICFFCGNISWAGGTERVSISIANELYKKGHDIVFLSLSGSSTPSFELNENINCYSLFKNKKNFKLIYPLVILKLRIFLKKHMIDTLIDVDTILSLYSLPSKLFMNIKHISWEHFNLNTDFGMKIRRISRKLSAYFSDYVITLTSTDRTYWLEKLTCKANIIAIPNPIPFSQKSIIAGKRKNQVLALGRLTYQKGFDRLIYSWSQIENKVDDWELLIVGSGENELVLKQQCHELGLRKVKILPATPDVHKLYAESSIYAMTSRFEGFPMVLLEASCYGLPIISFDCDTGPSELIENGVTGILVENDDKHKFGIELLNLIHNEELRNNIREKILIESKKYHIENIIKKWQLVILK
ncbi:glycosyltransferase family 4 protein [Providencia sp. wls1921]|uniref:WbcM protein n=1 Tax=Providencia alcalifaciens TaxID=126385 RepID=A0A346CL70_9GAMM|nr:glycosyltransferase family 4 protein [Providencia sp. wls1921]AXL96344.1 WbcM protein [Providencia alcalifaciens]MTC41879.1 glycosyltransferase [Providencia sp. wls1921]